VAALVGAAMLAGCGPAARAGGPAPRVFLIVMENHSPAEALQGAFTASLAARYGEALDYHAVGHPSVPNYLALESGSTWGVSDWRYHALPAADLGAELTRLQVPWRAYMEGLGPQGCISTPLPYDPGHDPFAFFSRTCPPEVVPLSGMAADLRSGSAPRFVWISPDRCHDEHDCPVGTGDAWLRSIFGEITGSPAWEPGSALFITWDEDDGSADNSVLTLVVTPSGHHRSSTRPYNHYSLLATVEDLLHVPRLGHSREAVAMRDLVP
jgi:acid phosphatase